MNDNTRAAKVIDPFAFFSIFHFYEKHQPSQQHLKMKTIIFDRNLYILNGIVNCKHSTTTKNFWMNPFSIITKGGEGNLQIFDRMNFDFSLQINGGWRWVEQLIDERISSVFFATNNVSRCGNSRLKKKSRNSCDELLPSSAAVSKNFRRPI